MKRVASTFPVNMSIKFRLNQFLVDCRLMTGLARTTPNFIIIGAQRSGTTALYNTLAQHSCITPAIKKEILPPVRQALIIYSILMFPRGFRS